MSSDKENMKNSIDLSSGNNSVYITVTSSSGRRNYNSSNTEHSSNENNDEIHDVQEYKKA